MTLHEGENVGPYRVIGQLGQGGMATVYKAYHPKLNRYVAIKMMHQAFLEDKSFLARFEREAQIVARLEHPHIVPIFDYNEHQGQPYLVMKFVEGQTLKGILSDGPLSLSQIMHILSAVGEALTYAHNQGVLHRDIKPSNIVLDSANTPYLTDFGLARIAQAGESSMSQDMLLGTPHYISPEQAKGKKDLDGRTDIYSLGVVLYELVVGRVPFSADTPYAVVHDHIYSPLPLPRAINPDVPPLVEQVLLKALAKDPADRYETATEMVQAFRDAVEKEHLTELKPERASIAAVSLAKLREEDEETSAVQREPAAIPAPIAEGTPSIGESRERAQARRNLWILGGVGALAVICMLATLISLNAMNTLTRLAALSTPERIEPPTAAPTTYNPAEPTKMPTAQNVAATSGVTVYDVPSISVDQAQALVSDNPNQPVAYLALARALWEADRMPEALETLGQGRQVAEDQISYLVTVGNLAVAAEQPQAAITAYLIALNSTQEDSAAYPTVRAQAGFFLYQLAVNPPADLQIANVVQQLIQEEQIASLPLVEVMQARLLLTEGRLSRVRLRLSQILREDRNLAEAQLVLGELFQAEGDVEKALQAWQSAMSQPDAPDWVRHRASELITSVSGA